MISTEGHGTSFDHDLVAEFRATGGHVGGIYANKPLCVLNTIGAKSGQPRSWPLGFSRIDGDIVVIASNDGKPRHPAWYHNLVAHPDVTVELPDVPAPMPVRARVATGVERNELFARVAKEMPDFLAYQAATARVIPVVVLARRDAAPSAGS